MKKPLVAIGDDSPDILSLMEQILGDAGYATVAAADGDGVARLLAEHRPDVLILDVRMPGSLAGLPLLEAIRRRPATVRMPIVVATADLPFLREHAATLRALGCETLAKPFDLDALLGCVASLLPRPGA